MPVLSDCEARAVGGDCTDLLALRRRWFPDVDDADGDFEQDFRDWWERERHQRHAVVAYLADEPVGMANGLIFSRMPAPGRPRVQWMYGANVFVVDEHRRKGVGYLLMTALIDFARAGNMARVVLAPSEISIPLYQSLGFRVADDLMRLDLRP